MNSDVTEVPVLTGEVQDLAAGTKIFFENVSEEIFGTVTVVDGVLDIVYFDGTSALVRMGKFPIRQAVVLIDSKVIIGKTDLRMVIEETNIEVKSGSNHTHWSEKSCWDG